MVSENVGLRRVVLAMRLGASRGKWCRPAVSEMWGWILRLSSIWRAGLAVCRGWIVRTEFAVLLLAQALFFWLSFR